MKIQKIEKSYKVQAKINKTGFNIDVGTILKPFFCIFGRKKDVMLLTKAYKSSKILTFFCIRKLQCIKQMFMILLTFEKQPKLSLCKHKNRK